MKVLITGSTGFIGSKLKSKLQYSYDIVTQSRGSSTNEATQDGSFLINIDRNSDWGECLRDVGTVIHLAGVAHNRSNNINTIDEVNFEGTINLAKQSITSGVKRLIYISSINVFGSGLNKPFDENTMLAPESAAARTRVKAETELQSLASKSNLELVIIRSPLVYDFSAPGNFKRLVKLVNLTPVLPFGLCVNSLSVISLNNLLDFISTCIGHPKAKNEVFCISDGIDVSIRIFTDEIAKGLNKRLVQLPIPVTILKLLGKMMGKSAPIEQLIGDLQVDSSKARELLDWTPPVTMTETFSKLTNNR
jgi:nucleoside-diphosphate-sugar epimerase